VTNVWYRIHETLYAAPVDEWENPIGEGSVGVHIREYQVLKETPKGVWLARSSFDPTDKKFVLLGSHKRWAAPTIPEAWESFRARKRKQISIMLYRAKKAEMLIRASIYAQTKGKTSYDLSPYSSEALMDINT